MCVHLCCRAGGCEDHNSCSTFIDQGGQASTAVSPSGEEHKVAHCILSTWYCKRPILCQPTAPTRPHSEVGRLSRVEKEHVGNFSGQPTAVADRYTAAVVVAAISRMCLFLRSFLLLLSTRHRPYDNHSPRRRHTLGSISAYCRGHTRTQAYRCLHEECNCYIPPLKKEQSRFVDIPRPSRSSNQVGGRR